MSSLKSQTLGWLKVGVSSVLKAGHAKMEIRDGGMVVHYDICSSQLVNSTVAVVGEVVVDILYKGGTTRSGLAISMGRGEEGNFEKVVQEQVNQS